MITYRLKNSRFRVQPALSRSSWIVLLASLMLIFSPFLTSEVLAGANLGNVGTFGKWSKVEIDLIGPNSIGMSILANPFEIVVDVTFTGPSGQNYVVPAFYDGNGAGVLNGNIWKVRFSPDEAGTWSFISTSADALLNNYTGTFDVTNPVGCTPYQPGSLPDFSCVGRLEYVGDRYLKFRDGPYWLKGGVDDPEDFLAPAVQTGFGSKNEAIDFLAGRRVNSLYMMLHNTGNAADGQNVWPWVGPLPLIAQANSRHFDVQRLNRWEQIFTYLQQRGIVLHLVLQDDSAFTAFDHDLYYRQMVARFGHHNGLVWNISEEYQENYTVAETRNHAQTIRNLDAYDHPITVHHNGPLTEWNPFLGDNRFDMTSFQTQTNPTPQNDTAITWMQNAAASGRVIPISFDETGEIGPGDRAVARDIVWSVYMGGANFEMHSFPLTSYLSFSNYYADMSLARTFIESLPFTTMQPFNTALTSGQAYIFADPGNIYTAYLPTGGTVGIDLTAIAGPLELVWLNPRTGALVGSTTIAGGSVQTFTPPFTGDAVLYIAPTPLVFNYTPPVPVVLPIIDPVVENAPAVAQAASVDLELAMAVTPPFAMPRDTVTWTITVRNPSNFTLNNILVTDLVPAGLQIVSATASAGSVRISGQTVDLTLDALNSGQTVTITLVTRLPSNIQLPFSITNTANTGNISASANLLSVTRLPVTGQSSRPFKLPKIMMGTGVGLLIAWLLYRVNHHRKTVILRGIYENRP